MSHKRFDLAGGWHLLRVTVRGVPEWIICDPDGDRLGQTTKHKSELDAALLAALERQPASMGQETTLREQLSKLSPADRDKYNFDLAAFGTAMLRELEDGTVVYVSRSEWPPQMQERQKREAKRK